MSLNFHWFFINHRIFYNECLIIKSIVTTWNLETYENIVEIIRECHEYYQNANTFFLLISIVLTKILDNRNLRETSAQTSSRDLVKLAINLILTERITSHIGNQYFFVIFLVVAWTSELLINRPRDVHIDFFLYFRDSITSLFENLISFCAA